MIVVAYVRISDMDADPLSKSPEEDLRQKVKIQRGWAEEEAARRGWTLVKVYEERHTGTVKDRPQLNLLKREIVGLGAKRVLVYSDDRLGRDDLVSREIVNELAALGADVHFGNISFEGMEPAERKLFWGVKALISGYERDIIVRRLSRGAARARSEGTFFSELPNHFEQDDQGIIRPSETALAMGDRRARGDTLESIAREFKTYRRDVQRTLARLERWLARPPGIEWRRGKKILRALRGTPKAVLPGPEVPGQAPVPQEAPR